MFSRLFKLLFIVVLFISSNSVCYGEEEYKQENNTDNEVIRVGYTYDSEMIIETSNYLNNGYGYDILKKVEEYSQYEFEFVELNTNPYTPLLNNEVDLIGFYKYNEEYSNLIIPVTSYVNSDYYSLVTNKNIELKLELYYDDPSSIDNKTVATYLSNPANELLDEYCAEHNIEVSYLYYNYHDYLDYEADLYLTTTLRDNHYPLLILGTTPTTIIGRAQDYELVADISAIIDQIKLEEGNFLVESTTKYLYNYNFFSHRTLTRDEVDYLREDILNIGYLDDSKLITYTDNDGVLSGILIETIETFSDLYDFEVNYIPFSYDELYNVPNNFDILLTIYGKDSKIHESYVPTEVVYNFDLVAIYDDDIRRKHANEFNIDNEANIGTLNYLFHSTEQEQQSTNNVTVYNSLHELLDAYKRNEITTIVITNETLNYSLSYLNKDDLNYSLIEATQPITFFVNKDLQHYLIPIFNTMLSNINIDTLHSILAKEKSSIIISNDFMDILYENWYIVFILVFVVVAFLSFQNRKKRIDIEHVLNTDKLTNTLSQNSIKRAYNELIPYTKPNEYELISFDIDFFKMINTYRGVDAGNEVLVIIGKQLNAIFKDGDAYVSRIKDDNFVVLRKTNSPMTVNELHYNHILPQIFRLIGDSFDITMSYGVIKILEPKLNFETALTYADYARNKSKRIHDTTFVEFNNDLLSEITNIVNITKDMELALKNKEFKIYFQPKIDLSTLKINGAEALIRWIPNNNKIIYPDKFIPIFENNGFIVDIDLYVFDTVCRLIRELPNIPVISVNLSAKTLNSEYIVEKLLNIVDIYNISIKAIELEITESAYSESEVFFLERINKLKDSGFNISIDDFGAGLSSLNRLSLISPNFLKIDKAFLDSFVDEKSKVILKNIFSMANQLQMQVVAEGVEDKEQALWLKNNNCQIAQGYYFEKPMSESDFLYLINQDVVYSLE